MERDSRLLKFDSHSGTLTITPLGCLLGGVSAAALYAVCLWQVLFWWDVFGLG